MNGTTEESKVVDKKNGSDSIKIRKAKTVDKKPGVVKKPLVKVEAKSESNKKELSKDKKVMTRSQIAEKKYGVDATWHPFEIFFNKQKEEKTDQQLKK